MKKKIWLYIVLGVLLAAIIAVFMVAASVYSDFKGSSRNGELCKITIPEGSTVSAIAGILEENGAVNSALNFRLYSKFAKTGANYRYGSYEFKNDIGFEKIAEILSTQGQRANTVTVTIPEGTGIYDFVKDVNGKDVTVPGIATLFEKSGLCTKEEFLAALNEIELSGKLLQNANTEKAYCTLEGYLFPNTYDFYVGEDGKKYAKLAIEKMIAQTETVITDDMYKRADELGLTMNEVLTLASIIQMEAGQGGDELKNVAGVFYNRLNNPDKFPTLGSSPTCYYGSFNPNDDDRYDTYKIKGLPPGPLCSPGEVAIKATLYPTENTPYFYFVTDKNGKFYYHKTGAEQSATINRLQQEGNWIYEYFK